MNHKKNTFHSISRRRCFCCSLCSATASAFNSATEFVMLITMIPRQGPATVGGLEHFEPRLLRLPMPTRKQKTHGGREECVISVSRVNYRAAELSLKHEIVRGCVCLSRTKTQAHTPRDELWCVSALRLSTSWTAKLIQAVNFLPSFISNPPRKQLAL